MLQIRRTSDQSHWLIPATILYTAATLAKSLRHIFWGDEWQTWMMAKMQPSLALLLREVHYEGHPPFWYVLEHYLSRMWDDPASIKIVHALFASATVWMIWKYGPFSLMEKILLPFGYFFIFEYSTIARSYAPGILLAVIVAANFRRLRDRPASLGILLLLMAQISIFGMVLSMALAAAVMIEWRRDETPALAWILPAALALSLLIYFLTTRQPPDGTQSQWMNDWYHLRPLSAAAHLFDAYVPLPKWDSRWWGSQIIDVDERLRALLGVVIFCVAAVALCRTTAARALLIVGTGAVFAITFLIYTGALRHWGHYFIILLLAVWIDRRLRESPRNPWPDRAFVVLLVIQTVAGIMATLLDFRQPFSASRATAQLIQQLAPTLPIAGKMDSQTLPISGELNRPIYSIRSGRYQWYGRYDTHRHRYVSQALIEQQVRGLAEREKSDVLLVMGYAVYLPPDKFEFVGSGPTATAENYWVYRYRRRD
jgi:hypothetical protein